ncbi:hypothetical protein [Streptomyces sp. 142MFCol3.1]|uniref:hypothetical protein n=1 Tax=Streptomyces sp. 142MFCol3.1 TaxID=1172179 RepID=UPI000406D79B|nr:hypothetical protein [Streptomyces sp. 142MFCol3.1]
MTRTVQVAVTGDGRAGLAAGYHLCRPGIESVILDARAAPGAGRRRRCPAGS